MHGVDHLKNANWILLCTHRDVRKYNGQVNSAEMLLLLHVLFIPPSSYQTCGARGTPGITLELEQN